MFFHTIAINFVLILSHNEIDNDNESFKIIILSNIMLMVTKNFSKRILLILEQSIFSAQS